MVIRGEGEMQTEIPLAITDTETDRYRRGKLEMRTDMTRYPSSSSFSLSQLKHFQVHLLKFTKPKSYT